MICVFIVFHNLVVFHIVVRNGLTTKHYQSVFINHVKTYEPNSSIYNGVKHNPRASFNIELLNWGTISTCFISDSINISVTKGTAIRSSNGLLQTWQCFLIHGINFKLFTLLKILTFQGATDYVNEVFKLCYSKVNSVIHHFS